MLELQRPESFDILLVNFNALNFYHQLLNLIGVGVESQKSDILLFQKHNFLVEHEGVVGNLGNLFCVSLILVWKNMGWRFELSFFWSDLLIIGVVWHRKARRFLNTFFNTFLLLNLVKINLLHLTIRLRSSFTFQIRRTPINCLIKFIKIFSLLI